MNFKIGVILFRMNCKMIKWELDREEIRGSENFMQILISMEIKEVGISGCV